MSTSTKPRGLALKVFDAVLAPLVAAASLPMRLARTQSMANMPLTFGVFRKVGVFPIKNHYYEPLYDTTNLSLDYIPRSLPGIDLNIRGQLALLESFVMHDVISNLPTSKPAALTYHLSNPNFGSGDAELWFHVIRHFRPKRIVEIGSGHSTLMARLAIQSLCSDDDSYVCDHVCVEPYEMPWLEQTGVRIIRERLENCDLSFLDKLDAGDVLFIDSSHIIRPQGDVLQEFLSVIPRLKSGVVVHVHDIFTPRDYPKSWIEWPYFWNEQYILEAFLTDNRYWEVLLAANMLKHEHYEKLAASCPSLRPQVEPGSFYIRRR